MALPLRAALQDVQPHGLDIAALLDHRDHFPLTSRREAPDYADELVGILLLVPQQGTGATGPLDVVMDAVDVGLVLLGGKCRPHGGLLDQIVGSRLHAWLGLLARL